MILIKKISIITGHYGSGKTNIAVNLALDIKKSGKNVTIVDLDIVNPYFRTADFKQMLENNGIKTIVPTYANTNLDIPALPASINALFNNKEDFIVIDVGGDDAGAIALGRYSKVINELDYDLYYVINKYRYLTKNADEALEVLSEIETASNIKATKIINNSNLGEETTLETVTNSFDFAKEVSSKTNLPIAFTTLKKDITDKNQDFYPVDIFVKTVWNK